MRVEYYVVHRPGGWMIERHGQYYGPYPSREKAVQEALYVANYSIKCGLEAHVTVQRETGAGTERPDL